METLLPPASGTMMGFCRAGGEDGGVLPGCQGRTPPDVLPRANGAASALGVAQNETGMSLYPGRGDIEGSPAHTVSPALSRERHSCAGLG